MKIYRLDEDSKVCPFTSADGNGLVLKTKDAPTLAAKDQLDFGPGAKYRVVSVVRRDPEFTDVVLDRIQVGA